MMVVVPLLLLMRGGERGFVSRVPLLSMRVGEVIDPRLAAPA
jgi:hypothetical protein